MREDWIEVELQEVFETVTGNTPSKREIDNYGQDIPFIKPPDITNSVIKSVSEYLSLKGKKAARILPEKSILITCIGNLGRVGFNKEEVAFNQQINAILPNDYIDYKYTFYQGQSGSFRNQLESLSTSTTVALVNKSSFNSVKIEIAPLPIQRAIVSKIEALFSDLDNGIANFKKAQEQLKIYRQAVLKKAFEGELTKEWREKQTNLPTAEQLLKQIKEDRQNHDDQQISDWKKAVKEWEKNGKVEKKPSKPSVLKELSPLKKEELEELKIIPYSWMWVKLGNCMAKLSDGPFGSHLKTADYIEKGIRVVRLENIKNLFFDDSKKSFVSLEKYNSIINHTVYSGDIVFSTFIADETKVAIVPSSIEFAINKADCICIRPHKNVSNKYLEFFLSTRHTFNQLVNQIHGATRPRVNTTQIKSVPFLLCSLQEQTQIVQEIESRLSVCDKVEQSISESILKAEALRQSILKKAFEGRLLNKSEIEQCKKQADYEPATELLKKIKAEKLAKEQEKKKPTIKKKSKK